MSIVPCDVWCIIFEYLTRYQIIQYVSPLSKDLRQYTFQYVQLTDSQLPLAQVHLKHSSHSNKQQQQQQQQQQQKREKELEHIIMFLFGHKCCLHHYIELSNDTIMRSSHLKYVTHMIIASSCTMKPFHMRVLLQNCFQLEYLEIEANSAHDLFSDLPPYPAMIQTRKTTGRKGNKGKPTTAIIPALKTLKIQSHDLRDSDLEHIAIALPNLEHMPLLYNSNGFSAVGLLFLEAYVDFDINSSFDNHIYGVYAYHNEKNISVHY